MLSITGLHIIDYLFSLFFLSSSLNFLSSRWSRPPALDRFSLVVLYTEHINLNGAQRISEAERKIARYQNSLPKEPLETITAGQFFTFFLTERH